MSFQHIPVKAISVTIDGVPTQYQYMGFNLPSNYPVFPGNDPPPPDPLAFRWEVTLTIANQQHSSIYTRAPGVYTGMDIEVGQWIGNITNGQSYQIISVTAKSDTEVTCIIQDIFRYNTFKDPNQTGEGGAPAGGGQEYVVFEIGDNGTPAVDPKPENLINPAFWINLISRFNYIDNQYDFALFQRYNTFALGDAIAIDPITGDFVKASSDDKITIGRVTSISDTLPNWFTINPVAKIDDLLDALPGNVGDIIYTDVAVPGALTTATGGDPVYVKLRDNGLSQTKSVANASAGPGTAFQVNGVTITVSSPGNMSSIVTDISAVSAQTGVNAAVGLVDNVVPYNPALQSTPYLSTVSPAAKATINGVEVIFDIAQTWGSDLTQAGSDAMAAAINASKIPGIVASSVLNGGLTLTNTTGGAITIVNTRNDTLGTPFAGPGSASGLPLSSSASTSQCIVLTAVDARAINLLNVITNPLGQMGLVSVENAPKACGLFIGAGLRQAANTVVVNLAARDALDALIGDQAFVIDSDDGSGNYVNQWSTWLWNGSAWVLMARESVSVVAAKTLEFTMSNTTASSFQIGEIVTGTRITDVSVEVLTAFGASATLELGYSIANPTSPTTVSAGIMTANLIDLSRTGMYVTTGDILFGTNTVTGDITITGTFNAAGSSTGSARILVSYV